MVVHDGQIREKPVDEDQAREFLRGYGNAPCSTVGAIADTNLASSKRVMALDTAAIHFSPFPDAIVETLIAGWPVCPHPQQTSHVTRRIFCKAKGAPAPPTLTGTRTFAYHRSNDVQVRGRADG